MRVAWCWYAVTGLQLRALTHFYRHSLAYSVSEHYWTDSDIWTALALIAFNASLTGSKLRCAAVRELCAWWWWAEPRARRGRASRARHRTRTARVSWKACPRGTTRWWARTGWWIYPPPPPLHLWVQHLSAFSSHLFIVYVKICGRFMFILLCEWIWLQWNMQYRFNMFFSVQILDVFVLFNRYIKGIQLYKCFFLFFKLFFVCFIER